MLNYFFEQNKKKEEQGQRIRHINTADIIKKTEDITDRWISTGMTPEEKKKEDKEKKPSG